MAVNCGSGCRKPFIETKPFIVSCIALTVHVFEEMQRLCMLHCQFPLDKKVLSKGNLHFLQQKKEFIQSISQPVIIHHRICSTEDVLLDEQLYICTSIYIYMCVCVCMMMVIVMVMGMITISNIPLAPLFSPQAEALAT